MFFFCKASLKHITEEDLEPELAVIDNKADFRIAKREAVG